MRLSKFGLILALPFALIACEAEEEPVEEVGVGAEAPVVVPPAEPAAVPAAPAGPDLGAPTINLQSMNNSGVTGTATLTPLDGQTRVRVELVGASEGPHMGHIHQGTCDNLGSVMAPLEEVNVVTPGGPADMTTEVRFGADAIMDGNHVIAYHQSGAPDHGPSIACGAIPQRAM